MSSALRRGFALALYLVLAAWVYEPVLRCGPLGPDYEVLAGASRIAYGHLRPPGLVDWRKLFVAPGAEGHPIAAFSLGMTSRLFTEGGVWTARALHVLRIENLLLLAGTALLLGRFLQRLLLPWTGSEHALAAGQACSLLFAVHPLCVPAVAGPGDHDLLIGGLFASGAALAFLRGRQERRDTLVFLAGALALLCAVASDLAWMLVPALALTEFLSAHRYRPLRRRLQTALTTLLCFGACAVLPALLRAGLDLESGSTALARSLAGLGRPSSAGRSAIVALERFGYSVLPVNAVGRGATGPLLGMALLLVAVQPALRAARSAPRLWAGAVGAWALLMLLAVAYRLDARVHPLDLSAASTLLPAVAVMAAGMGLSATALTGRSRLVMPALAVLGAAQLARAEARCLERSARASALLLQDLVLARSEFGAERPVLVLDPPDLVAGHPANEVRMEWMLDPAFGTQGPRAEDAWVRGVESPGFRLLAVSGELAPLCAEELVVLAPLRLVEEGPVPPSARRLAVRLERPMPSGTPLEWGGDPRSPQLDVETLERPALLVLVEEGSMFAERPTLSWEGDTSELAYGSLRGIWLERDGEFQALFDLSSSFRWLLAGRVHRLRLGGELGELRHARLLERLPAVEQVVGPRVSGNHWVFDWEPGDREWTGEGGEPVFVLTLLDRLEFQVHEITARPDGSEIRFSSVEPYARAWRRSPGGLLWSLEERRSGNAVARTVGR